jgi:hypothetical protein
MLVERDVGEVTLGRKVEVTSLLTKAYGFSDVFRPHKTKVADFTSQFHSNYRLKPYIIQAHAIKEAKISLERLQN